MKFMLKLGLVQNKKKKLMKRKKVSKTIRNRTNFFQSTISDDFGVIWVRFTQEAVGKAHSNTLKFSNNEKKMHVSERSTIRDPHI